MDVQQQQQQQQQPQLQQCWNIGDNIPHMSFAERLGYDAYINILTMCRTDDELINCTTHLINFMSNIVVSNLNNAG